MLYNILIVFAAAFAVAQSTTIKLSSKKTQISMLSFNMLEVGAGFFLFLLISFKNIQFHLPTLIYALLYGCALLLCTIFGYLALTKGSMALTSLLCAYSVVIPCLFGVVFLHEAVRAAQCIGLALLFLSMYLLKQKDETVKFEKSWGICLGIAFVCKGICSVIQKLHQIRFPGEYCDLFSLYSMLLMFLILLALTVFKKEKPDKKTVKFALPAGIFMGIGCYLPLVLSAHVSSVVLFPAITIFTVLFNFTASKVLFKEKFTAKQIAGILIGILSVICLK